MKCCSLPFVLASVSSVLGATSTSTAAVPTSSPAYQLVENLQGSSFFSGFNFVNGYDPSGGQVQYVSAATATQQKLAYVASDGTAVIKLDNTTDVANGTARSSVRIESVNKYQYALWVYDIVEQPWGCGTWPAVWTLGEGQWPDGGEVDVIEQVNNATVNDYTVHTAANSSCTINNVPKNTYTGTPRSTPCSSSPSSNSGCGYYDVGNGAYGPSVNANGGGIWAAEIKSSGIKIWRFNRGSAPADIASSSPDPAGWGTPGANFPSTSSCQTQNVIKRQQIIINITLCGVWAGQVYEQMGCPGTCSARMQKGSNFPNAAWRFRSIRVYQQRS